MFFSGIVSMYGQDPVFETMKSELDRNFTILNKEQIPAYYIFLRLEDIQSAGCVGRMGRLQSPVGEIATTSYLTSAVRVGDYALDNTHELRDSYGGGLSVGQEQVAADKNPQLIKNAIWGQLDNLYKQGIQTYEQVKANMAVKVEQEDKSPDFSKEKADKYYEAPLGDLKIDAKIWEDKIRKYSAVFDKNNDLLEGIAIFQAVSSRTYIVDTEGREIAQNSISYQLMLIASATADDGMELPLYKTWFAYSPEELPSDEEVLKEAEILSEKVSTLKKAPVVESFTGPALLSAEAAGVFFHEIFGHRVEGSRMKQESDAQTFKKKINELVLPKHISVTFDPTIKSYKDNTLSGSYVYDDEGIKSQRVEIVKNGVLKNFLMCRTPIEGFLHSNGHGRAQIGEAPISRQSNMIVESTQKYSDEELRKMLIKEAKSQGKTYAYYFKEVSGGFTNTDRFSPNSFNVSPLIVYRIYTDGRPDELVRGVDLVGTPLAMFSQLEACGGAYAVFNGTCGAESGGVPVSCFAPCFFVKRIETQKVAKSQEQPPILPKP